MKILLVWPRARYDELSALAEPLALEYLAAGLKLDAHQVEVLDLRLHPDELDGTLMRFRPDMVGVTAYSVHVSSALAVCGRAKQLLPSCRTVAGGHHATLLPEDFFETAIDFEI